MTRALPWIVTLISCLFVTFHMIQTQYSLFGTVIVQNVHIGTSIVLVGLVTSVRAGSSRRKIYYGVLLALIGCFSMSYIGLGYERLINAQGFPETADVVVGIILLLVVAEATRLHWGLTLPLIAFVAAMYYLFGGYLPGAWAAPMTSLNSAVSNLSIGLYSGLFGQFMSISANDVFLFMVLGGLLEALGASNSFKEIGKWISRYVAGGAGLTTVVSSGLMGTITGTAVSNVAICGTYTIPMMRRDGYTAEQAAAIEATSSTGGQLMPPVMGSVAFIMAALLAVPYIEIVKTAIMPALLFYVSVFFSVVYMSKRLGIKKVRVSVERMVLLFYFPLFIGPLLVMTVLLANLRSVAYSAFFAIVTLIVLRFVLVLVGRSLPDTARARLYLNQDTSLVEDLKGFIKSVVRGVSDGGVQGAAIAMVMGVCGVMSESITATGAAVPLGWLVDIVSGDSLFIALAATAVMCLILGAGMPTVGAYILSVSIAGPIVVANGLDAYTANFFILYFACLSAITPPVAAAVLPASAIAGSSYWRTAYEATILSAMLYLMPFLFVYEPALLARNMPGLIGMSALLAECVVVSILVAAATQGYFLVRTTKFQCMALLGASLCLMLHICNLGLIWLGAGLMLVVVVFIQQYGSRRLSESEYRAECKSVG